MVNYFDYFFALFWGIWYLIAGEVPATNEILTGWNQPHKQPENFTYTLPFAISRWWDILFAPIYANTIIIWAMSMKKEENFFSLFVGLIPAGMGCGLILSSYAGQVFSLFVGLLMGLFVSLFFGLGISISWLANSNKRLAVWKTKIKNWLLAQDNGT